MNKPNRPDPKNCDELIPAVTNPPPSHIETETIGKDLNQWQQDSLEQNKRSFNRLGRFLWS